MMKMMAQPASIGTLPEVRASTDPGAQGADYYGPSGSFEMRGYPIKVKSNKASHSKSDAKTLWKISEKLTGIKYKFS